MLRDRSICRRIAIMLIMSCAAIIAADGPARASTLRGGLEPGPHGIAFTALERYDYSRSFGPKRDYFGAIIPGERGRPVQVCIWYPSERQDDVSGAVYGEYAFVYPDDTRFFDFLSNLQTRELGVLFRYFGNNRDAVMDLMSVEMTAVRDATHAVGPFPLLIYQPDFNNNVTENSILFEYLASHGFVVAATHSFGAAETGSQGGPADLETLIGDMEFAIAAVRDLAAAGSSDRSRAISASECPIADHPGPRDQSLSGKPRGFDRESDESVRSGLAFLPREHERLQRLRAPRRLRLHQPRRGRAIRSDGPVRVGPRP